MSSTDTGQVPSLSSSSQPASPTHQPPAAPEGRSPTATAVLGPTLRFKGDISAEEDFILQGRVQGSIHHAQRIVIGTQGAVAGNIYARVVVIDGNVEGDLHGVESVVVHETGRVVGNIFAPRVGLSDGAVFNGRIDMSGTSIASQGTNKGTNPGGNQGANPAANHGVHALAGSPATTKRVESPTMSPGLPMSAEATEKILAPRTIAVLPPPARRERVG